MALDEAARVLLAEHGAERCASQLRIVSSAHEAARDADVLVLVTEWKEFRSPDFATWPPRCARKAIFDGRNIYHPATVAAAGLYYEGIGRSSKGAV